MLIIVGVGALSYWAVKGFKRLFPNAKYWIKYKIFRKKHNEEEVVFLLGMMERGFDEISLLKYLLLSNKMSYDHAREMVFVFKELKKYHDKTERRIKEKKHE
jgi:hypothetical protein